MSLDTEVKEIARRENCPDFDSGDCSFYQGECFHEDSNERGSPASYTRYNRLVPREGEEFMEWMGELCSDCNEVVCNGCEMFIDYH